MTVCGVMLCILIRLIHETLLLYTKTTHNSIHVNQGKKNFESNNYNKYLVSVCIHMYYLLEYIFKIFSNPNKTHYIVFQTSPA